MKYCYVLSTLSNYESPYAFQSKKEAEKYLKEYIKKYEIKDKLIVKRIPLELFKKRMSYLRKSL